MALVCGFFWVFRSAVGLVGYTFLRLLGYLVGGFWVVFWVFAGFDCELGVLYLYFVVLSRLGLGVSASG